MSVESPGRVVNHLIERLPREERRDFLARGTPVKIPVDGVLCEPERSYRHAYFPLSGTISLVAAAGGQRPLEIGTIGNEGMLGATLVLGIGTAPLRGIVQRPGTALRLTVAELRGAMRTCPPLLRVLHRYLYVSMAQLAQTAACNRFHEVEARLARWLLMTHDRAHTDHFHFTQRFLADVLGVRRSAVSIAATALQKKKLIRYKRGDIHILSREGLEAVSCGCYEAMADDYARLFSGSRSYRLPGRAS